MGSVWWVCVVEDVEVASTPAQWFIDILFITRDSRMSNKLSEKSFTV